MASKIATSRLRKELAAILANPPSQIYVSCDDSNILHWNYLLEGPKDTPYEGGWYWGRLHFPKQYPFAPPSIFMMTPSGRFECNTRLCLSMSDYHPESWQPAWSVATVLLGLLSFMCEESPALGAISPPPSLEDRRRLAAESIHWNRGNPTFMEAFPEFDKLVECFESTRLNSVRFPEGTVPLEEDADAMPASSSGPSGSKPGVSHALHVGASVSICGLVGAAELNGKSATCVKWDAAKGRWLVSLGDGVEKMMKPENLKLTAPPRNASLNELAPGARVQLVGLQNATELNGKEATCVKWDESKGRWLLHFEGGVEKNVKPENLVPCKVLLAGTIVRITGLAAAPDLNGKLATCIRWDDAEGRWLTRFRCGDEKLLRPDNLEAIDVKER